MRRTGCVQERSRPIEPPKKPEAAPFFLPTVPGLEGNPVFDLAGAEQGGDQTAGQNPSAPLPLAH